MSELGITLREAREAMGLNLEDLQERTKIQKRYLQAIEEGNFDRLPGHFYTRAFIKSYAETVGLDTNELFETYRSEIPKSGSEIETLPPRNAREAIRPSSSGTWTKNLPVVAVVVIVLAIAVGVWFLAQQLSGRNDSASAQKVKQPETSYTPSQNIGNGTTKSDSTQKSTGSKSQDQTKSGTSADPNASNQTNTTKPTQKLTLTKSQGSNFTYTLSGAKQFKLDVTANKGQSSWVGIFNTSESGKRYYYGNLSATGSNKQNFSQDLSSLKQIYLKIGNVRNVTVKINGQTLAVQKDPVFQHITIINKP